MALMLYLIPNYPNQIAFLGALQAVLESGVEYLEIQLPFSNPVADGPVIYQANQHVLQNYNSDLVSILQLVSSVYKNKNYNTKVFLMSYLTPMMAVGLENVVAQTKSAGFSGFIIPDLTFGSPEQISLTNLCNKHDLQLIPVVSPLTTSQRLEVIKKQLLTNQLVYAMARVGKTGDKTSLENIQPYLDNLKTQFANFKIAVGFGINNSEQVDYLNRQNLISVIGTELIKQLSQKEHESNPKLTITTFLQNLLK